MRTAAWSSGVDPQQRHLRTAFARRRIVALVGHRGHQQRTAQPPARSPMPARISANTGAARSSRWMVVAVVYQTNPSMTPVASRTSMTVPGAAAQIRGEPVAMRLRHRRGAEHLDQLGDVAPSARGAPGPDRGHFAHIQRRRERTGQQPRQPLLLGDGVDAETSGEPFGGRMGGIRPAPQRRRAVRPSRLRSRRRGRAVRRRRVVSGRAGAVVRVHDVGDGRQSPAPIARRR